MWLACEIRKNRSCISSSESSVWMGQVRLWRLMTLVSCSFVAGRQPDTHRYCFQIGWTMECQCPYFVHYLYWMCIKSKLYGNRKSVYKCLVAFVWVLESDNKAIYICQKAMYPFSIYIKQSIYIFPFISDHQFYFLF